jgi:hypothetical protein
MTRLIALFFIVLPLTMQAQTLPPGMTMHRSQTGEIDSSGWIRATSSKGEFSVRLPCPFNDFTVDGLVPEEKAKRSDTVGCARGDQKRFSVTRIQYRNPQADARAFFEKGKSDFDRPGQRIVSLTVLGAPAFDVEMTTPRCAFARMIHVFPDNYLLVAEAVGDSCRGLGAMAPTFFDSLQIGVK